MSLAVQKLEALSIAMLREEYWSHVDDGDLVQEVIGGKNLKFE